MVSRSRIWIRKRRRWVSWKTCWKLWVLRWRQMFWWPVHIRMDDIVIVSVYISLHLIVVYSTAAGLCSFAHVSQAYSIVGLLVSYVIPLLVFAYCYAHILHTVRRQSKIVTGRAGQTIHVSTTTATVPASQTSVQLQQQATGTTTTDGRLSRSEINVLQTMITVIVVFVLCWGVPGVPGVPGAGVYRY